MEASAIRHGGPILSIDRRSIMKKIILSVVLSALSLSAMAQTDSATVTISGTGQKSDLLRDARPMAPDEFNRFAGSYELSNGQSLSLFSRDLKKFAVVQGEAWHELVATSANSFVSADRTLRMKIRRQANGDVSGEVEMAAAPDRVAKNDEVVHMAILARR
jgi:hypothetical protein